MSNIHEDEDFSWEKYACLLRSAWLNPSNEEVQGTISEYEHRHKTFLDLLFVRWRIKMQAFTRP